MKTTHFLAGLAVLASLATVGRAQVAMNEIYASMAGTDTGEFYELIGTPGTSLTGYMVLVVEGDFTTSGNQGKLKRAYDLTGKTIPASGYFVMGDTAVVPNDFPLGVAQDAIENGSQTYYFVNTATPGAISALLNTNVDSPPGSTTTVLPSMCTILDIVAQTDAGATDVFYDSAPVLGPDPTAPTAVPGGLVKCNNAPNPWSPGIFVDFGPPSTPGFADATVGASNTTCTAPPSVPFCEPGVAGVIACPCGNPNGASLGCANTGGPGASLSVGGTSQISADNIVFTGNGMFSGVSCIFLQGNALVPAGVVFGAGVRCAGGSLKRLYVKTIVSGSATGPDVGIPDPTVTVRSATLGDTIPAGASRYYQCYYRDPTLPNTGPPCGGTNGNATFNITSAQKVTWAP